MGIKSVVAQGREADGRVFAPKFLSRIIKQPGQYRVRLYSKLGAEEGDTFQGQITSWYWPKKGEKGTRRKLSDGSDEARRRQAAVDALRMSGDTEGANEKAARSEYWFCGVLKDQPTIMRVLDLRSEFQFKKVARAIANAAGLGVFEEFEETDDFSTAFDVGWSKISGPTGSDLIIIRKPDVDPVSKKPNDMKTLYGYRIASTENDVLPLAVESAFNLKAVALEEDSGGKGD